MATRLPAIPKRSKRTGRDNLVAAYSLFGIKPPRKKRDDAEFRLQCTLADVLTKYRKRGVWFGAIPMGEERTAAAGSRVQRMGGQPGSPDLLLIIKGRAYGLELKAGKGTQTKDQEACQWGWEAAGGAYAVANGYDEALTILVAWGALPAGFDTRSNRGRQVPLALAGAA